MEKRTTIERRRAITDLVGALNLKVPNSDIQSKSKTRNIQNWLNKVQKGTEEKIEVLLILSDYKSAQNRSDPNTDKRLGKIYSTKRTNPGQKKFLEKLWRKLWKKLRNETLRPQEKIKSRNAERSIRTPQNDAKKE